MNRKVITTTGYYATGSSAIYDLLKEYRTCTEGNVGQADVEHLMLYTPNGLFDLEDKLLIGNNIHRSDEALRSFYNEMRRINDNNFVWFGNYKEILGPRFMQAAEEMIENLTDMKLDCKWSYDYLYTKFSLRHVLGSIRNIILKRPVVGDFSKGIVFREKDCTRYSYASAEEFYSEARKFVDTYFDLITGDNEGDLILDHFILPNNLFRMENYFGDSLKVVLVERDPRDVFIGRMRAEKKLNVKSRVPGNIDDFIVFWKKLRNTVREFDNPNILFIQFEDLIYKYDETVKKVEDFCGYTPEDHIEPKKYFKPEVSIKNTQSFLVDTQWSKEIKKIEECLPEYLYDFPANK